MIRTLIIDDERFARDHLRELLAAHGEIEVVGEAATMRSARELLTTADYALVLLDIQLLGGSGFDLLPEVRPGARVIFVTAHNEHALRAFEVNALDYLLKPVTAARLAKTLARVEPPVGAAFRADDMVHLACGRGARFVPVGHLTAIEANENYTFVHLHGGDRVLVRRTLKAWEESLPPADFMRVHRTMVVNRGRITGYERDAQRTVQLRVEGLEQPVPVSRVNWPDVKRWLQGGAGGMEGDGEDDQ